MSMFKRFINVVRSNLNNILFPSSREESDQMDSNSTTSRAYRSRRRPSESSHLHAKTSKAGQDPILAKYYANLELSYGAPPDEVRSAWKRLLRLYHPDRHLNDPEKSTTATLLTQELTKARDEIEKAWRDGRLP